jgi:riboflavin synthase alpha subunit
VDIAACGAVAADDDDAVDAVVPPSSTKDEDAYVGASVAFEGACVGAFADGADESAAASVLLPPRCRRRAVPGRSASRHRHHR